jgi:hypothetical protein
MNVYHIKQCHTPENSLHKQHCENLKSNSCQIFISDSYTNQLQILQNYF